MRVSALGGVIGPIIFALATITAAAITPGYSHVASFISELGAPGLPGTDVMNLGGFLPAGALLATFGLTLMAALPRRAPTQSGAALVVLFGVGVVAAGIWSCDAGCPQNSGTMENVIHNRIGPATFVSLIVGTAILGFQFRKLPQWEHLARYTLLTSLLGAVFLAGVVSSLDARVWTGLWQRLLIGTQLLWCAVTGLSLYRASAPARATVAPA